MKNCANYGDVTHSGTSYGSYIGGIAGNSQGSSSSAKRVYIYNSINLGTITHDGTTSSVLYLGGIAGSTYFTNIENCVSAGKISTPTTASYDNYIGSIVGYVYSYTSISYCYYTSDLSDYGKYGSGTPSESNTLSYDSTSFELSEAVSIGDYTGNSLIGALNTITDYYALRDYSHWLLNKNKKDVSFTINGRTPFTLNSQIILMPSLASEGNMTFDGWYIDSGLTKTLAVYEITSNTDLYGRYCGPNIIASLDVNGGDELNKKEVIIGCDRVYGELPTPSRMGYTFLGWFNEKNENITKESIVKTPNNHTIHAHWLEKPSSEPVPPSSSSLFAFLLSSTSFFPTPVSLSFSSSSTSSLLLPESPTNRVEIIFDTKSLTTKEIEEVIKHFTSTNADFEIAVIEHGVKETRVIVKFVVVEAAQEFVRGVNEALKQSGEKTSYIRRVYFIRGPLDISFSISYHPMRLFLI